MNERIYDTVAACVKRVGGCEPRPEAALKEELGLDSLSLVTVVVELEGELGVTFDDADLDPAALLTVADLTRLVEKYL